MKEARCCITNKVCVSGGFDPIHSGHLDLMEFASQLGEVYALVNADKFLIKKKGYICIPEEERLKIVRSIRWVKRAEIWRSDKQNVAEWLEDFKPQYFVNGGDRTPGNVDQEEVEVCQKNNIKMVYYGNKVESSSKIADNIYRQMKELHERRTS